MTFLLSPVGAIGLVRDRQGTSSEECYTGRMKMRCEKCTKRPMNVKRTNAGVSISILPGGHLVCQLCVDEYVAAVRKRTKGDPS